MSKCKSFLYKINKNSKILILGSMPGIKSLEEQQYYAHPQNRFWKVMGDLCNRTNLCEADYDTKINILLNNGFALWDVLACCDRDGSLDSDIKNEIPNKIPELLNKYKGISKICFNGNKSYTSFKKYFPELLEEYNCYKLPSTGSANARYKIEDLLCEWRRIL